jgi:riboflavin biosynthesis pyrimidine reductase
VRSLMVEGGAQVITCLYLSSGLADCLILTIAPFFVGGLAAVEQRRWRPPGRACLEPHYTPSSQT